MIERFNQYSNINEKNKELKSNKKIVKSLTKVNKLLQTDYRFDLTNIVPLHVFYQILFEKYQLDDYDISLLIINQIIKTVKGNKDDYDKITKELKIKGLDIFSGVVDKVFENLVVMFNLIMKKYNLLFNNKDLFTKKYTIPLVDMVTRYVHNYNINIMDFSDLLILNEEIFKDIEKFIIKSLHSTPEKYSYFFDKIKN